MLLDDAAATADPALPAFLAPPGHAPAYHGFVVLGASEVDGWTLGMITEFGVEGDGFVVAPDGRRAGLVWTADGAEYFESGGAEFYTEVLGADERRWGVYAVGVRRPLRGPEDARSYLAALLPWLHWAAPCRARRDGRRSRRRLRRSPSCRPDRLPRRRPGTRRERPRHDWTPPPNRSRRGSPSPDAGVGGLR